MLHENILNRCFFYSFKTRRPSGAETGPDLKRNSERKNPG
jgi:hypothetical protein